MDSNNWLRLKQIFNTVLERKPEERRSFIDEACGNEPELRREIEALLSSHEESKNFMELPSSGGFLQEVEVEHMASTRVGQYLLMEVISSGGMGTVYKALQEKPRRTVAVKIMRRGITSQSALRRFEYEAQILARLTHPHIARIIETGTHHEMGGLPYFVMEYIPDALPITRYAWEKRLSTAARLGLFLQACDAVHHGHQKGVIHRDLKPSNILVDGEGQVKIIDFGVARATDSDITLATSQTDVGQLLGTLQYMSPEQCRADPDDLDMRSDVYALGVLLYELLCEQVPYDVENTVIFEATRIIQEAEPRRPSTVNRALKGDVETIVLKALEKERTHRYQSVADFGADLRRYLNGELILARPAGPATRMYKLMRRNPVFSTGVGVGLIALFVFLAYILLVSYPQIKRERDIAEEEKRKAVSAERTAVEARNEAERQRKAALDALEQAELQRQTARAAEADAEREAKTNKAINEFLRDMLSSPDPFFDGPNVKVIDVLERAAAKLDAAFSDEPEIEASLRNTLGWTYKGLGEYRKAEKEFRKAIEASTLAHGERHPITLDVQVNLSQVLVNLGHYEEAESILREAIDDLNEALGADHQNTLFARSFLASVLRTRSKVHEAEKLIRGVIEAQQRVHGDAHRNTLFSKDLLAGVLTNRGQYSEAESLHRDTVETARRVLGEEDLETLTYLKNLGRVLLAQGKDSEAEKIFREVVEVHRRIKGEDHPSTLDSLDVLAVALGNQGKFSEAAEILERLVRVARGSLGAENPKTLDYMNNLAAMLSQQGKLAEAKAIFEEVLDLRIRIQGKEHNYTMGAMANVARMLQEEGEYGEAERMLREVLALRSRVSGENHPTTLQAKRFLACVLMDQDKDDEAERLFREILEVSDHDLENGNTEALRCLEKLALLVLRHNRYAEAEEMFSRGLEIVRKHLPPQHILTAYFHLNYGECLLFQKRYSEAEEYLHFGYEAISRIYGKNHQRTLIAAGRMVELYEGWGKEDQAAEWRSRQSEERAGTGGA